MGTQNFGTSCIVRFYESWSSLLEDHPEIDVRLQDGKIADVLLPKEVESSVLVILSGEVAHLEYYLNNEHVKFTSPDAHKSKIYEFLEEYNKQFAGN